MVLETPLKDLVLRVFVDTHFTLIDLVSFDQLLEITKFEHPLRLVLRQSAERIESWVFSVSSTL